jgi:hypothetical protein
MPPREGLKLKGLRYSKGYELRVPARDKESVVRVGRLRYCGLTRMLLHDLEAIRLLDDRLDIPKCVPRHDGKSGRVAAELHVLGVCEGNFLNAVEIAAFAEEVRHSPL